jgi:putative transposase
MLILRAYKTELDLNNVQKDSLRPPCWGSALGLQLGLGSQDGSLSKGGEGSNRDRPAPGAECAEEGELSWMYEVSKCAPQEALRNLDQAYAHFFRRVKEKKAGRKIQAGFPKFKSKKNGLGGFRLTGAIHIFDNAIQLPRLGRLRLKERGYLPVDGVHILSASGE